MRILPAALVLVLLLPTPGAAWTQPGGDAERSGRVSAVDGTLDVLGHITLGGDLPGVGLVAWRDGLLGVSSDCTVVTVAAEGNATPVRREVSDCGAGATRLLAADEARGLLYVCHAGAAADAPIVEALHADAASVAWSLAATDLGANPVGTWDCADAALAPGGLFLALSSRGTDAVAADCGVEHRVARIDPAEGEVSWSAFAPVDGAPSVPPTPLSPSGATAPRAFTPASLTVTKGGVLVVGQEGDSPALVAFADDGSYLGGYAPDVGSQDAGACGVAPTGAPKSAWFAASDGLAAGILGNEVVVYSLPDGLVAGRKALTGIGDVEVHPTRGPAWVAERLVVPLTTGVGTIDTRSLEPGPIVRLAATVGPAVQDLRATPDGRAHLLFATPAGALQYVRVGLDDERRERALDLGISGLGGGLVVLDDRVVAWTPSGKAAVLGAFDGAGLSVSVSESYPSPGEAVTLRAHGLPTNATWKVDWGDGDRTVHQAGSSAAHALPSGDRRVYVTAYADDNTTRTWTGVLHVGGTPPTALGFVQKAFGPEYQDWTFTILGILFGVVSTLWAMGGRYQRRRRLGRDLNRLADLKRLSARDPVLAMAGLQEMRKGLRERALAGSLEEATYLSLAHDTDAVIAGVATRLRRHLEQRLPEDARDRLASAMEDGVLTPEEREALEKHVAESGALAADEVRAFRAMLRSWSVDSGDAASL